MNIKIDTLTLCEFDKDNLSHMKFLKNMLTDNSIKERFQGFLPNLNKKTYGFSLGKAYLVADDDEIVGYIEVSNYNKSEKAVYLREAIDSTKRKKKYGQRALKEFTDLIFKTYPEVEIAKARIANDNKASLNMADACGFKWISDDYYGLENKYLKNEKIK